MHVTIKQNLTHIGYDFENSHFTGYFITSRLDGQLLLGRSFKKGKESFAFRLNSHPEKADEDQSIHLHLDLNNQTHMTRSAFAEQESSSAEKCEDCGRYKGNCGCVEVIYCKSCNQQVQDGKCGCDLEQCSNCNYQKKYCICCPTCREPKPYCRCHIPKMDQPNNGNNNGGSNNGSYDNGNSGGHGGNHGGYNSGGGGSYSGSSGFGGGPGVSPQKPNPYGLNNAYSIAPAQANNIANHAVNEMIRLYQYKMAVCNFGLQFNFKETFPGHKPPGMSGRANDMVDAWRANSKYWGRIKGKDLAETLKKVQECIKAGLYVVAGWKNPSGASGHVVRILPGEKYSSTWKLYFPRTMDTGSNMRRTDGYLNNSFGPKKIREVEFYYYKK